MKVARRWCGAALVLASACFTGCRDDVRPKRQLEHNPATVGFIDAPAPGARVGSVFTIAGWAADESRVERVRIYLDDQVVATVTLTVMRPDVEKNYPKAAPGVAHGFQALVDAGSRAGYYTVGVDILDGKGAITRLPSVSVKIEQ